MFWLRLALGLAVGYAVLVALLWLLQERLAFPAPREPVPDPQEVGVRQGERIELVTAGGTPLVGWYLAPVGADGPIALRSAPGVLWFYGNGENIARIWPVLRDFQPPGAALLVVDYPGYGSSGGRATEPALYEAAEAAYEALVARPEVDRRRIYVYGRSLGAAVASWTAARHEIAGLILESAFTNAREMSRQHYGLFPGALVRLELDNLAALAAVRCPVLVLHGDADQLAPISMGRRVAAAATGPAEFVVIEGAGHNDTYDVGGRAYRDKVWAFVAGKRRVPGVANPGAAPRG